MSTDPRASDHLGLLLYQGTGGDTVPLAEFAAKAQRGQSAAAPYLGLVGLEIVTHGESLWPSRIAIGDLARLSFQMHSASERLANHEAALVRIAIDDFPVGGFFRFQPVDDAVHLSLVIVTDPDVAYRYPVDGEGNVVDDVYEHVTGIDSARSTAGDEYGLPRLDGVQMSADGMVADLAQQARLGRSLYDELGVEYFLELY